MTQKLNSLRFGSAALAKLLIICILQWGGVFCEAQTTANEHHSSVNLRTSLPSLAVGVPNLAIEYNPDLRWSLSADVRYSAWNLGSAKCKYRTFSFRPEVRRWFGDNSRGGAFASAHVAIIYYNVALPSWNYRIQDHGGSNPAILTGIGGGYRKAISKNKRWFIEGSLSVGAGRLNYDRFENRPGGKLIDNRHRFFFGIDDLSVSIVYKLNKSSL